MEEDKSQTARKRLDPDTLLWAIVIFTLVSAGLAAATYCYHDAENRVRDCIAKSAKPEECHDK